MILDGAREVRSFSPWLIKIITCSHLLYQMTKKVKDFDAYLVLLILGYLLFFQDKVQEGWFKSALDILLIILMLLMIIDKALSLYQRYQERKS